MIEKLKDKFTKYEVARILGARALQLSMDAPLLLKADKNQLEELNYDSLKIAEQELLEGVLPITIRRPLPKRAEKTIKKLSQEEIEKKLEKEKQEIQAKPSEEAEEEGEKEVQTAGEIMEMASPEDEAEPAEEETGEEI